MKQKCINYLISIESPDNQGAIEVVPLIGITDIVIQIKIPPSFSNNIDLVVPLLAKEALDIQLISLAQFPTVMNRVSDHRCKLVRFFSIALSVLRVIAEIGKELIGLGLNPLLYLIWLKSISSIKGLILLFIPFRLNCASHFFFVSHYSIISLIGLKY